MPRIFTLRYMCVDQNYMYVQYFSVTAFIVRMLYLQELLLSGCGDVPNVYLENEVSGFLYNCRV